jgi:tripartite-type tricarboxylate transporter receptor subunit TctC
MRSQSSQADRRAVLRRAAILLGGELLRVKADVRIGVVPFKGSAPLAQDLVAGNIPMAVDNLSTHAGLLQAGKLRALAVLQDARVATSPDIPSTAELGLPEVIAVGWSGASVRAGTPADFARHLQIEARKWQGLIRNLGIKAA